MLKRTITSVVALMVFFAVVAAGRVPFQIAILLVSMIMLYEVFGAVTRHNTVKVCGYITGLLFMAGINLMYLGVNTEYCTMFFIAAISITMLFTVFLHGTVTYREMFSSVFMALYVVIFMSFIYKLRDDYGLRKMGLIFLTAWGSDTAAYFCGTFFGKHKLIPKVSPKKTVEGSVGAVIITTAACVVYGVVMAKFFKPITDSYVMLAILGFIVSVISQFGDLAASAIKRDTGIKDYGKIFPGHGGFMDRFDSVIFIAPVVYYMVSVLL